MEQTQALIRTFRAAAEKVSAVVTQVGTMIEACSYAANLCARMESPRLPIPGGEGRLPDAAETLYSAQGRKRLAAPRLLEEHIRNLAPLCEQRGIDLVQEGLRGCLEGVDVGFTMVDFGIAETGTLVIDSSSEEIRLATMISDAHVAVLPVHRIRPTAFDLERELKDLFAAPPRYGAFITGASRTADIERVLALGVHGPLELHILLLEECSCSRT